MNTERVYDETATIVPVSPFVAMTFVEWVRIALTGMVTGVLSMGAMLLMNTFIFSAGTSNDVVLVHFDRRSALFVGVCPFCVAGKNPQLCGSGDRSGTRLDCCAYYVECIGRGYKQ